MRTFRDILFLLGSIALAVVLTRSGALDALLAKTAHIRYIDSFVAGGLFTSIFTVIPATVAIAGLVQSGEPFWELVLCGALGAMVVDVLILALLKDTLTDNILSAVRHSRNERLKYFFRRGKTRLAGTLLGAVIIASPLPDELGLLFMGLARSSRVVTVLVSFLFNAIGIAAVYFVARSL